MRRLWMVLSVILLSTLQTHAETPEYDRSYGSTAANYPTPSVNREDFDAIDFVDAPGSTAIFTIMEVDGVYLEEAKAEIRNKLPNAHVRQIVSGSGGLSDQSLMVMWHPKEAYRPAINDYFRVLNPMRGVKATYTSLGISKRFPRSYPSDTMIGWKFVKFDASKRVESLSTFSEKMVADPDVLEVAELVSGDFDAVVVYRYSGASLTALAEVESRISSLVGTGGIQLQRNYECP